MGLFDTIRGVFSGEGLSGILESSGLGEHVEGLLGDAGAIADDVGIDLGQVTESLSGAVGDGAVGDVVQGLLDGGADITDVPAV
jgi:hypothetical protein